MIINLNETVSVEELSELSLSGVEFSKECKVELTFSKEALIGFATNLQTSYDVWDSAPRWRKTGRQTAHGYN